MGANDPWGVASLDSYTDICPPAAILDFLSGQS